MLRLPLDIFQQVINQLSKDKEITSLKRTVNVFFIIETVTNSKDTYITEYWLLDIWLLKLVGYITVKTKAKIVHYWAFSNHLLYWNPDAQSTRDKNIHYNEFIKEGKYKEWVKDYERMIDDSDKSKDKFKELLLKHPVFDK